MSQFCVWGSFNLWVCSRDLIMDISLPFDEIQYNGFDHIWLDFAQNVRNYKQILDNLIIKLPTMLLHPFSKDKDHFILYIIIWYKITLYYIWQQVLPSTHNVFIMQAGKFLLANWQAHISSLITDTKRIRDIRRGYLPWRKPIFFLGLSLARIFSLSLITTIFIYLVLPTLDIEWTPLPLKVTSCAPDIIEKNTYNYLPHSIKKLGSYKVWISYEKYIETNSLYIKI